MILIIDNYDSFTYNLYQDIEGLGYPCHVIKNDQHTVEEIIQMKPEAIVLSPGPGRPENAGVSLELLQKIDSSIPVLGICLGHQIIGESFGYITVKAPKIVHGKVEQVCFSDLELPASIMATRYHSLMIQKQSEKSPLLEIGHTKEGVLMAVKHKSRAILGLQFHPESYGSSGGLSIIERFFASHLPQVKRKKIS